ncbi:MAG TPA: sensor histidine kinase KdpD [Anaerolineales bacterium]|jgi:two-component system sensor histidine kinase KdpD
MKIDPNPNPKNTAGQSDEKPLLRGQLKIFLGYAAGVGKTYSMLKAARQRKDEGLDVIAGLVDTHGQVETGLLLDGIESVPAKSVEFHGAKLTELDVSAVLLRHPRLVLVDELARTNTPGSRHPRRYQDVQELLSAGIDVYTTLNIQNLESLNDVVRQITGARILETIPDRVFVEAGEIEVIDLPPDELLQRLHAGKVHISGESLPAPEDFFRKGNLTALREITLRRAAGRVDTQMRAYMQTRAIPGPWNAAERLIVYINPKLSGEHLVRSARRLADELKAEWFAVYVEIPEQENFSSGRRTQVARTLRLAEELGARTKILPVSSAAPNVAAALFQYARKHNVTKIIAGKPERPGWMDWMRGSNVNNLIKNSGNIDIYVINTPAAGELPAGEKIWQPHRPLWRYLASIALVVGTTLVSELFGHTISSANLVMVYLLSVVLAAVYLGRGPAIVTSIVGVLAFDYFYVTPRFSFSVADTEYLLTFSGLLIVGWVISYLTIRAREQAEAAQRREADTALLYALSRDLAAADGMEAVFTAIRTHMEQSFAREAVVFLAEGNGLRPTDLQSAGPADTAELDVALWAFKNGETAGRGTNNMPAARYHYLPLTTARRAVGVIGVKPQEGGTLLSPDQRRLLEAFASQSAQAIERVQLAEQARQIKLLQAAEKLQNALLNSISHDLRTPLVSITGALTTLEQDEQLDETVRRNLVETAREEADRLNRLVGNLLDMTRLESGALQVKREPCDAQDLIGAALGQMEARLADRQLRVEVAPGIPLVAMDFVLIVHVIMNLLDNALKYSPKGSPLEVRAGVNGDELQIAVLDRGIGIPQEDLQRVFDKFYRVQRSRQAQVTGTGLGLAIGKGIIEAHGGHIWADGREGGGTEITFALPMEEPA